MQAKHASSRGRSALLLALSTLAGVGVAWAHAPVPVRPRQEQTPLLSHTDNKPLPRVREVAGYKSWARVNPKPALFSAAPAGQCASPYPFQRDDSPHRDKYVFVYVNSVGEKAMLQERAPHFPQGTVIVKEKLRTRESAVPELLTVMTKQKAGFNPANGDWEYMVLNGAATHVQTRGKLEKCQNCHRGEKQTDYIFRTLYLPQEVAQKLR